jgi:(1->4)-alpha-D-glucan 1-alpha-D-glucosylmutase
VIATYRLQLRPEFAFEDAQKILPYLKRLGVSHLYLSPITESRRGSTHGYDVIDHNQIREELGGAEGFERLRQAALEHGLGIVIDWVPNHAGVGPRNAYWQDVLAYGPHSPHAMFFDIDWEPLKPQLKDKILLPFLGSPYGEALDNGELGLSYADGRFYATYYESRFNLSPASFDTILERGLAAFERTDDYFDVKDLWEAYQGLAPHERDKAEGLRTRLVALGERVDLQKTAASFPQDALHDLFERQFWRLAYWKTAGHEINYRRFFDINELVALHMEFPEVFWESHRLLGELLVKEGVEGVRIDHVDGLFDPHAYLEGLKALGAKQVWVEKILAPGETLPEGWITAGTSGYEFMNDAMGVLTYPDGEHAVQRLYRRLQDDAASFGDVVYHSKRLVMGTSLSGELFRLANGLDRLSEADYRTRDFTLEALREALAEIIAAFGRYRSYLPYDPDEARGVIREAIAKAKRRNPAFEHTVYAFIETILTGEVREDLTDEQRRLIGRFQQYTAPVTAKGVEDTAFYRYVPLVALNEVGGEPEHFGTDAHAFHARARFRAYRYPRNLLATATHDHKRGEDVRMRLIVLAELHEAWTETVNELMHEADRFRANHPESFPLHGGRSRTDEYLFYQLLLGLWIGSDKETLPDRLVDYMRKAVREAKVHSSWLNPNEAYEASLEAFVRGMLDNENVARIIEPLAQQLAHYGFTNSAAQLVLKLTTPGVPDFYQGTEFLDLSLVDPDNRRPVDYDRRQQVLQGFEDLLEQPDAQTLIRLFEARDEAFKLFVTARLLHFRQQHPELFTAEYRALEATGEAANHVLAFTRETQEATLLGIVPRYPATLEQSGGWGDTHLELSEEHRGRTWTDVLTGQRITADRLALSSLPLPFAVLASTP